MHMLFPAVTTLLFSLVLLVNSADPILNQAWVHFCDDDNCSENCGEWVSINNPGCLEEHNRGSFYVKGYASYDTFLAIISPKGDSYCSCQSQCKGLFSGHQHRCVPLQPHEKGDSYRFITGIECPKDNCAAYLSDQDLNSGVATGSHPSKEGHHWSEDDLHDLLDNLFYPP